MEYMYKVLNDQDILSDQGLRLNKILYRFQGQVISRYPDMEKSRCECRFD